MATQRIGQRAPSPQSAQPRVAALAERVSRLWRRRSRGASIEPTAAEVDWERRFETVEARIEHLETTLEGLQDALYRHEVLDKNIIGELRRQTDPEQMARDLSQDARRRGL
jgi:arylsulfatase A-like enzyme